MSAEFIPHMGYVEMPNPNSSSSRINLRITGRSEEYVYMNEAHLDKWALQGMRGQGAQEWKQGPTEDSPEIPGQYRLAITSEMNVRMLEMHERILPTREAVEAPVQDIGPSRKVLSIRQAS